MESYKSGNAWCHLINVVATSLWGRCILGAARGLEISLLFPRVYLSCLLLFLSIGSGGRERGALLDSSCAVAYASAGLMGL